MKEAPGAIRVYIHLTVLSQQIFFNGKWRLEVSKVINHDNYRETWPKEGPMSGRVLLVFDD